MDLNAFFWTDMNGDGVGDFGTADLDGNGFVDATASDADWDGYVESYAFDTTGDGVLDAVTSDTDLDGILDTEGYDVNGDGVVDHVTAPAVEAVPVPQEPGWTTGFGGITGEGTYTGGWTQGFGGPAFGEPTVFGGPMGEGTSDQQTFVGMLGSADTFTQIQMLGVINSLNAGPGTFLEPNLAFF